MYAIPFSQFRQQFPRATSMDVLKAAYENHIWAIVAKDPNYRWSAKVDVLVRTKDKDASRAFTHGDLDKKLVVQFGKVINWDLALGW